MSLSTSPSPLTLFAISLTLTFPYSPISTVSLTLPNLCWLTNGLSGITRISDNIIINIINHFLNDFFEFDQLFILSGSLELSSNA